MISKSTPRYIGHRGVDFEFEYIREKSSKFETALGHLQWDLEVMFGGKIGY